MNFDRGGRPSLDPLKAIYLIVYFVIGKYNIIGTARDLNRKHTTFQVKTKRDLGKKYLNYLLSNYYVVLKASLENSDMFSMTLI